MRTFLPKLAKPLSRLTGLAILIMPLTSPGQVENPTVKAALTNTITITNGATTFAGPTNVVFDIQQGKGLCLAFQAYATNAGQITWYGTLTGDGTNYDDPFVWGNTLAAAAWIKRSTNLPPTFTDNHKKFKLLMVSNSADTVYPSNVCVLQQK